MMKSNWMRNSLIYLIILVAAVVLLYQLFPTSPKPAEIGLDQAIAMSQDGEIAAITVDNEELLITTLDGRELKTAIGYLTLVELKELGLNLTGVDYNVKPSGFDWSSLLIGFIPLILFGALI
ncbi:MAG: cell division protein FtsH, partial [Dehalococcoidia bacterium]|nr:cell division protein FtsH [Dehalococcoidia bacterium]